MDWPTAEVLLGVALLATIVAFALFAILANEVARESRASEREQAELFDYLRKAEVIFAEYLSKRVKEDA